MGLKKGMTNNPNGRPTGSVNKVTGTMREKLNMFLEENFDIIQEDFKQLDPKDKLLFYTKILPFGIPTLKAVDHSGSIKNKLEGLTNEQINEVIFEILNKTEL
jgi:hypothetical protein